MVVAEYGSGAYKLAFAAVTEAEVAEFFIAYLSIQTLSRPLGENLHGGVNWIEVIVGVELVCN